MQEKERYLGSVRFFKNMILLVVIICIAVPTVLAVKYHKEAKAIYSPQISADAPKYESLYPDFHAKSRANATTSEAGTVYLTFDDGPSELTPKILDVLKSEHVKATFFVVGTACKENPAILKRIVKEGHSVGMHTYNHQYEKIYSSVNAYLRDNYKVFKIIKNTTGVTPKVFRMPGGSLNSYDYAVDQRILTEMLRRGFVPYDWNISSGDATGEELTTDEIYNNVMASKKTTNRCIVLMHDSAYKTATSKALRSVIEGYKERGWKFARLTGKEKTVLFDYNMN